MVYLSGNHLNIIYIINEVLHIPFELKEDFKLIKPSAIKAAEKLVYSWSAIGTVNYYCHFEKQFGSAFQEP